LDFDGLNRAVRIAFNAKNCTICAASVRFPHDKRHFIAFCGLSTGTIVQAAGVGARKTPTEIARARWREDEPFCSSARSTPLFASPFARHCANGKAGVPSTLLHPLFYGCMRHHII